MKRYLTLLITMMFFALAFANNKEAVSMVSYEQSWLDAEGTLALKNNTDSVINRISIRLKYFDMKGNLLDYQDFFLRTRIEPGLVKKVNVSAYEHSRNYHYYKTPEPLGSPLFKIEYQLLSYYNETPAPKKEAPRAIQPIVQSEVPEVIPSSDQIDLSEREKALQIEYIVFLLIFIIGNPLWLGLYIAVFFMARKRKRNEIGWLLLSFVVSPVLIIILLWLIGTDDSKDYNKRC